MLRTMRWVWLVLGVAAPWTARAEEEAEPKGKVDVEVVVGAGQVDALNANPGSTQLNGQLRYQRDLTPVTAAGIVVSGQYEVSRGFALGLRLPVAIAQLRPPDDSPRTSANLGNIEVEAEYEKELSRHATIFVGGHVAVPTASGSELPTNTTLAGNQAGIDPVAADGYAINKAVSNAYGDENTALWLAGYLGLVPVVGMKLRFGRLRIEPYVKVESMFSVRPDAQERAIVELVAGGRVAVTIIEHLDLAVRAWGGFTLTDHEGDLNIGVVEPEVRVGGERWRVTAGVLIPFAGELASPQWIAGRLTVTVAF
jgi:hypothetical protein